MSQTRVIPSYEKPFWHCQIGNDVYAYQAGITTTVPDEVAQIIDNINGLAPQEEPMPGTVGQVWTRTEEGEGWGDIPEGTVEEWTFELADGTSVTKKVKVGD